MFVPNFIYIYFLTLVAYIVAGTIGFYIFKKNYVGTVIFWAFTTVILIVFVPWIFNIQG